MTNTEKCANKIREAFTYVDHLQSSVSSKVELGPILLNLTNLEGLFPKSLA